MIVATLGKLFFKLEGWTYDINPDAITDPKNVFVGFPHTTNRDGVHAVAILQILKLNYHIMVKQEWFKNAAIGSFLKKMGCFPVDRAKSKNVVQQVVELFEQNEKFTLVVAPEATRGKDGEKRPIRTGFWHIAKAANVPIVLAVSDSKNKKCSLFAKIYPSDSMENDLLEIKRLYSAYGVEVHMPEST